MASPSTSLIAFTDGASRGNPGPASYGVVIQDAHGNRVDALAEYLGEATNNVAEYRALLAALHYAVERQIGGLKIYCDSELMARQMQGVYRVNSPDLKPLFERARKLAGGLASFSIHHVRREQNREADELANQALDQALQQRTQKRVADQPDSAAPAEAQSFLAVAEGGRLRPLAPLPELQEGAKYEVQIKKRSGGAHKR